MIKPILSKESLAERLCVRTEELVALSNIAGRHYDPFDVQKPNGTSWRHLDNPSSVLKAIQRKILARILYCKELPETMFGGAPGPQRNSINNAKLHTKQPVVVTLDIKNFFLEVDDKKYIFPVFNKVFQCRSDVAGVLTKLTTFQKHLPQGAPTSSYLANLAILPMHDELNTLCDKHGLTFSVYVDDICFAGIGAEKIINDAVQIIRKYGFSAPHKKQKIMRSNGSINGKVRKGPQVVTGQSVNRRIGKPWQYRENIAQRIFEIGECIEISSNEIESGSSCFRVGDFHGFRSPSTCRSGF